MRFFVLCLIGLCGCFVLLVIANFIAATVVVYLTYDRIERSYDDRTCIPDVHRWNPCIVGIRHRTTDKEMFCTVENVRNGQRCSSPAFLDHGICEFGNCVGTQCVFDVEGNEQDCPEVKDIGGSPLDIQMTNGICNYRYSGPEINAPCGNELGTIQCEQQIEDSLLAKTLNLSPICDGTNVIACAYTSPCGIHDTLMMARDELKEHVRGVTQNSELSPEERAAQIERLQNHVARQKMHQLRREQ